MMDFDLNQLGLNPEEFNDVNFDKMPTTIGGFTRPPQPGVYLFQLPPAKAIFAAIKPLVTTEWGQRVGVNLKDDAALLNITLGEPYNAYISNTPRYIGKDENRQAVSDWLMLLKALEVTPDGNNNAAHVKALLSAAGMQFKAEHTLTANCSVKRDIYKDGKVNEGVKGCGQNYAVKGYPGRGGKADTLSIPKDESGLVSLRFACTCGAEVSCFGRLQGFRAA
jgi:hypothetical protein